MLILAQPSPFTRRLAAATAFLVAIAIPLRASGVAPEQTALGLALIAALALFFKSTGVRQRIKRAITSPIGLGTIGVFTAWTITILFSPDLYGSVKMGGRTAALLFASVIIWATLSEHPQSHRLLWKSLILSALMISGVVTLSVLGSPYLGPLSKYGMPRLGQLLGGQLGSEVRPDMQFKAFAAAAMCLIPVVAWAGQRLGGSWRWWGYAYAPVALAVMVLTYNRAAMAGFMAMAMAGIVLLVLTKHRHAKALLVSALAAIAGAIAWISTRETEYFQAYKAEVLPGVPVETYLPTWLLDPHRQNIWKFVYQHFLDHPWVGNGIDQINKLPGATLAVPGLDSSAALVPSHPHNWALEILAETGVIGFVPVIVLLIAIAVKIARRYVRMEDDADLTLFVLMAGFWGSALFNFSIWAVWWQLTFFILFGVVAATRQQKGSRCA